MAVISYAQNREDILLNRLFSECKSGFYVDVGACYPDIHSVTKMFYERGWHGINIEPIHSILELLAHDRQRDINLHVGLSNHEGDSTFYECLTEPGSSTFCEEQAEVLRRKGDQLLERSMPITTLARVCEQYAGRTIEFLKIDVEGHEREVLEGADWRRYRPRVVLVEATRPYTNIPSHEHWEAILLAADYEFAFFDGLNRYYVRAEDRHLVPLIAVPANVLDDFQIYEHQRQIQELQRALGASHEFCGTTQKALDAAQAGLEEAQHALLGTRQAFDDSQVALHETRARLNATEAQLGATQSQLGATQSQLDATQFQLDATQSQLAAAQAQWVAAQSQLSAIQAQLAQFSELGPIAIGVARRLRRMSCRSPKLASIAKHAIRRAIPRVRMLVPDQ
jgi:FkbM family methyltransferase